MTRFALLAVLLAAVSGCGPDTVSPSEVIATLTESEASADVSFHFSPGDGVDVEWQQSFHEWITGRLQVQPTRQLQYFKYTGRAQMESITGRQTNGWADPPQFAVHSIWPHDGHEAIHVYSALVGRPSDCFNEGIAVAMNVNPLQGESVPPWGGEPVHDVAKGLLSAGRLMRLSDYVTTSDFREFSESTTYPQAGSFVAFLVETDGIEPLLDFFRQSARDDSLDTIRRRFATAYGRSLEAAETEWRAMLTAR